MLKGYFVRERVDRGGCIDPHNKTIKYDRMNNEGVPLQDGSVGQSITSGVLFRNGRLPCLATTDGPLYHTSSVERESCKVFLLWTAESSCFTFSTRIRRLCTAPR